MIKVIKSTAEYETALAEIERLIDLDPKPKSAEAGQLELLTLLLRITKRRHFQNLCPIS